MYQYAYISMHNYLDIVNWILLGSILEGHVRVRARKSLGNLGHHAITIRYYQSLGTSVRDEPEPPSLQGKLMTWRADGHIIEFL
jgi:hypothetical protein